MLPFHSAAGELQTASAAAAQMSRIVFSWIQKTGAPMRRSRAVPPPTPVTTAKKMKVTRVCFLAAATSAPDKAKTATPAQSR